LTAIGKKKVSRKYEDLIEVYILAKEDEGIASKTMFELKSYLGVKYSLNKKNHDGSKVLFVGKHLGPFLKSKKVEDIDQDLFREFCHKMVKKNKNMSFKHHAKTLNSFLRWCRNEGILKSIPEIRVPKKLKVEKRQREILKADEIKGLFTVLTGRPLLYVALYLLMGLRNMEILKLRWDEISFENVSLRVNPMNNRVRRGRVVPINNFVLDILKQLHKETLSSGNPGEYVFPSRKGSRKPYRDPSTGFYKQFRKALQEIGVERHITPHDLRATYEKYAHKNKDFTDTQREKMAGASIDVQKTIYVTMDADDLRGLENSVQVDGLDEILKNKTEEFLWGKTWGNDPKKGERDA
jgi:integrase